MGTKIFKTSDKLLEFSSEPEVKTNPYSEIELMIQLNDYIPYKKFSKG